MPKGKSKVGPIKAVQILLTGPILVKVTLEDFTELVAAKDLEVIRGRIGIINKYYIYIATDAGKAYYIKSKPEIPGIQVDIITEYLFSRVRTGVGL